MKIEAFNIWLYSLVSAPSTANYTTQRSFCLRVPEDTMLRYQLPVYKIN